MCRRRKERTVLEWGSYAEECAMATCMENELKDGMTVARKEGDLGGCVGNRKGWYWSSDGRNGAGMR